MTPKEPLLHLPFVLMALNYALCSSSRFKEVPTGQIDTKKFPTYPPVYVYACQKHVWMDEGAMLQWTDEIMGLYVKTAPEGSVPPFALDSYRCHMMGSAFHAIQDLGVEVEHILGGCTGKCQPLDVGVNKPIKTKMKNQWEDWMLPKGLMDGVTNPPLRFGRDVDHLCI